MISVHGLWPTSLSGFSGPLPTLSKVPLDCRKQKDCFSKNNDSVVEDIANLAEKEDVRSEGKHDFSALSDFDSDDEVAAADEVGEGDEVESVKEESEGEVAAADEAGEGDEVESVKKEVADVKPKSAPASLVMPQFPDSDDEVAAAGTPLNEVPLSSSAPLPASRRSWQDGFRSDNHRSWLSQRRKKRESLKGLSD